MGVKVLSSCVTEVGNHPTREANMNPDAKRQSPHGWYQERTKTPPGAGRAARLVDPPPRPSLLKLCQSVPPGRLQRPMVMHWIGQGADIHQVDASGLTALMLIAQRGDLELVRYLVGQGMRVNASDAGGFTALAWAAWYGHREVVRYLKSRGATIHLPAALFAAAQQGRVATLQLLQQVGARLRCGTVGHRDAVLGGHAPVTESTLLGHAAAHGQLAVVQFLLEDPCATSVKDRLRAMHVAIEAGHYRVASLLETGRDRPYLHVLRHLHWMLRRKPRARPPQGALVR